MESDHDRKMNVLVKNANDTNLWTNRPKSLTRRRMVALIAGLTGPGLAALAIAAQKAKAQSGDKPVCPANYYWHEDIGRCLPNPTCGEKEYLSKTSNTCKPVLDCQKDYYFNKRTERCEFDDDDDEFDDYGGGGCFLTTACVDEIGLADDCYELSTLRGFRDGPLTNSENGTQLAQIYYELAPLVLARIPPSHRSVILRRLYAQYILPSALLTSLGMNGLAKQIYAVGTLTLFKQFAPEELTSRHDQLINLFGDRARHMLSS